MTTSFAHSFPFDPTYGYDLDALLGVGAPEEPADFAAFWGQAFEMARDLPPRPSLRPSDLSNDTVEVFDIEFDSLGAVRVGGWLTLPRRGAVTRGLVIYHGYGGRDAPDRQLPVDNAAAIFPCARGLSRSRRPGLPAEAAQHVVHGVASRETYIHRGCVGDIWCAASALVEVMPEAGRRLDYLGGSFGGGMGALALPWDGRFTQAHLCVPSFGNHSLRLTMPCVGSGETVRNYHRHHPEVVKVLRYFDAATAARRIRIPTHVAAALFDPAVPPPGQFAVYNAIPARKELYVLKAGHFDYPEATQDNQAVAAALRRWFAEIGLQPETGRSQGSR